MKLPALTQIAGLLALGLLSQIILADVEHRETCVLSGTITLEKHTQILCKGDLQVRSGTQIVTLGHALDIVATGTLELPTEAKSFEIRAFSDTNPKLLPAGEINVSALTARGNLEITHNGDTTTVPGGSVSLEFVSVKTYHQTVLANPLTRVEFILNGEAVELTGPNFELP